MPIIAMSGRRTAVVDRGCATAYPAAQSIPMTDLSHVPTTVPPVGMRASAPVSAMRVLGMVLAAATVPAWARAPALPSALGLSCQTCHRPGAAPNAALVDLSSLRRDAIADTLRAFRSGARTGTVMPRIALALSDIEIDRIAAEAAGR